MTTGAAVGRGVGTGVAVGAAVAVGTGVGAAVGAAVVVGFGVAVGFRVALGLGVAVGFGVGVAVGLGVPSTIKAAPSEAAERRDGSCRPSPAAGAAAQARTSASSIHTIFRQNRLLKVMLLQ